MPTTANPSSAVTILDPGLPLTLINAITAAQLPAPPTQASAAAANLAGTNIIFTVQPRGDGGARTLNLHGRSATAVPTTATLSLYSSSDGGVTWTLEQSTIALCASTVFTDGVLTNLVAGLLYILLATAVTLGSATTVSVDGSLS